MKKLRADSRLHALEEDDRTELDTMLCGGSTLAECVEWLAGKGVAISQQALSDYYRIHVLPGQWARKQQIARQLAALKGGEEMTAAATNAVRQKVMDLATQPGADAKMVKMLFTLVLQAQAQELDARRVKLLEQKAAAADAAKAALEKKVSQGGLTPEALALAEEQLKLL